MQKTIYKYPLKITEVQTIIMPKGAEILSIQVQQEWPFAWALVDIDAQDASRKLFTFGTGQPITSAVGRHVGTYMIRGGTLVFHVFEEESR